MIRKKTFTRLTLAGLVGILGLGVLTTQLKEIDLPHLSIIPPRSTSQTDGSAMIIINTPNFRTEIPPFRYPCVNVKYPEHSIVLHFPVYRSVDDLYSQK